MATADEEFDFADMLKEFGRGATNRQMTAVLRDVVAACEATGKKGSVTLKLTISSDDGIAQIGADVKSTKPGPSLPSGSYYVTSAGGLVEEDPRQQKLPVVSLPPLGIVRPGGGNGGAS